MSRPLLEFGGGSGEILRDLLHLRSVSEAEALISGAEGRDHVKRNVKRWRGGQMMLRWVAAGVLEAAKGFRRLKGHADMPQLWRVLLMRLSAALVVASERWRRGERPSVSTVTVSSSPSRTLAAAQGCSMVETAGEVSQQPRRGLDVLTLIGALEDRQYPGPLTLRQMVEDVAGLVDLAARHQRGTTEHHGLRWRA